MATTKTQTTVKTAKTAKVPAPKTAAKTATAKPRPNKARPTVQPPAARLNKTEQIVAKLKQAAGATIEELIETTGWQAHSIRGAISGTLRKKLGLTVASELIEGRGRVYRIGAAT